MMSEWKKVTLEEICSDISYGYTQSAKKEKVGPKFLRITDIAKGKLNWNEVPYCHISKNDFEKYKLIHGDIVIARTGATTGANYTIKERDPKDVVFASYLIRYRINNSKAYPYFIGQLLQSSNWSEFVDAIIGGSAQPGANAKQLGSFKFLLPPLPEQRAIAEVLSSLDDKIDLLHRQNKTLEQIAETLFRQWFIEEAKEDWEVVLFEDFVQHVKPGTNYQPKRVDVGIPFLSVRCLDNGFINISNSTYISQKEYERIHSKWTPAANDVLISRIGTLGLVAVIIEDDLPIAVHYNMIDLKAKMSSYQFLYFLLKSKWFQEEYLTKARQSVQAYLAIDDVKSIELKLPIGTEEFVAKQDIFNSLFDKIKSNTLQIRTLEKLRDTLLPKLMSGEWRIKY